MAIVPIEQLLYGIRDVESGGIKDRYRVVNSIGAHGAYQVMRANIAPWTKEALGRAYTPTEFLNSPQAQDDVARFRLARDMKKYGSWEAAASVWFSGQPNPNSGASDGGNTVRQYVAKVRAAMAGGGTVTGATPAGITDVLTGGLVDILRGMAGGITDMAGSFASVGSVATMLMALALPSTWVRIVCGLLGAILLFLGLLVLGREAVKGTV